MTGISWSGSFNLGLIEGALTAAAEQAARLSGEYVLGESQKVVPIEEGTLQRSGRVDVDTGGTVVDAAISYSGPYACRQHEELTWRHDAGRTAKYLERPLSAAGPTVAKIVQQTIRQALP